MVSLARSPEVWYTSVSWDVPLIDDLKYVQLLHQIPTVYDVMEKNMKKTILALTILFGAAGCSKVLQEADVVASKVSDRYCTIPLEVRETTRIINSEKSNGNFSYVGCVGDPDYQAVYDIAIGKIKERNVYYELLKAKDLSELKPEAFELLAKQKLCDKDGYCLTLVKEGE